MKYLELISLFAILALVNGNTLPAISYPQLQHQLKSKNLQEITSIISDIGAFSIKDLPDATNFKAKITKLHQEAPECLKNTSPKATLDDGTSRYTSAISSSDAATSHPDCIDTTDIKKTFDFATLLVHDIIGAMNDYDIPTYYEADVANTKALPISQAPFLDHVHVYEKPEETTSNFAAPFHIDNGLFLLVTPSPDHPLIVSDSNGHHWEASEGDLVVVFGRGMTDWLRQHYITQPFRPAPHAVPSGMVGDYRVVAARMVVVPQTAVPRLGRS